MFLRGMALTPRPGTRPATKPTIAASARISARGNEHFGGLHRLNQLLPGEGLVFDIELRVEKLAEPRLHHVGQLTRDNNVRSCGVHSRFRSQLG